MSTLVLNDLTKLKLNDRDVHVFVGPTGQHSRGPIRKVSINGKSISFTCHWVATTKNLDGSWEINQDKHLGNYIILGICDCDDPKKNEIILEWELGYICIEKPGNSLKKPE